MLEMKTTSNGRRPQNIKSWISQQPLIGSFSNLKLTLRGPNQNKKILEMKTKPKGRRPQNIKSCISQQPLIRSSNFFEISLKGTKQKLKKAWNEDDLQRKTTS